MADSTPAMATVKAFFAGYNNGKATELKASSVADVLEALEVPAGTSNYTYSVNGETSNINTKLHDGDVVSVAKSKNKSGHYIVTIKR